MMVAYIVIPPFDRVSNPIEDDVADALRGKSDTGMGNTVGFWVAENSRRGKLRFGLELVSTIYSSTGDQPTHD